MIAVVIDVSAGVEIVAGPRRGRALATLLPVGAEGRVPEHFYAEVLGVLPSRSCRVAAQPVRLETGLHRGCNPSGGGGYLRLFLGSRGHVAGHRNDLYLSRFPPPAGRARRRAQTGEIFATSEVLSQLSYVGS